MQLIPSLVLQHLQNPEHIEELFVKYILAADLTIDSSKTIAGVTYLHKQLISAGDTGLKFFTGVFDAAATNVPGNSFIRPQSEHLLIWGIRWLRAVAVGAADVNALVYVPGVNASAWSDNLEMTIITNSDTKIKRYPLSEALSDLTVRENGAIPLAEPIFWAGQTEFEVDVTHPSNTPAAIADEGALQCRLIGMGLI